MASVDVTRIASNIGALNALNSLQTINKKLAIHQTRLQTGKSINSAADDPAGLTIATKMLARSEGMKVALGNISDANNMLSVAEAGMSKMNDILIQMRNKSEQAASDTLGSTERAAIQTQLSAYAEQIQDLVDNTKWNGVKLLDVNTGTKTFQTGADEGDKMTWTMADALDPATMNVSQVVTSPTTTMTATAGTGITGSVSIAAIAPLSKLDTGGYTINILDKSTAAAQGKVNLAAGQTVPSGWGALSGVSGAVGGELASGTYTLEITGGTGLADGSAVSYRVLNSAGTQVGAGANDDWSGASYSLTASDGGATIGVAIATSTSALSAGQRLTFEYIAQGNVKYELNDAQGAAQTVSKDGSSGTNTGTFGYYASGAGVAVNTGRGFSFSGATWANTGSTDSYSFDYLAAGNYVVDVSSSTKAAAYMTTINGALDKVTKGLSNLGSLMARLTFKEDAVTTAQANVEASYSRIMNANMAEEQVNSSKYSILQQTSTAMLAQANQAPQTLLSLFR